MNDVFKTHDQGLGAYLMLLGHPCVGAIPSDDSYTNHAGEQKSRMDFIFLDIPNAPLIMQDYLENRVSGKLWQFHKNTQRLRAFLREPMSREDFEALKK